MNNDQRSKIAAVPNAQWNEIWWFYPSSGSTECDRYVVYDYVENIWTIGKLDRTSGVDRGVFREPFWVDADGDVFEHEIGYSYSGSTHICRNGSNCDRCRG